MPRKSIQAKQTLNLVVNGRAISVRFHPPGGKRKSWYAYWKGLVSSKSTGKSDFNEAVSVVQDMLGANVTGRRVCDAVLSNEEFEEIQRQHFRKKTDPAARKRSEKSLRECLDAISAFRAISGLSSISIATPADCERFQREAVTLPKNWRRQYADNRRSLTRRAKKAEELRSTLLSPNTVLKWSVSLQASFERANRNGGKKCVRGVVDESKLLNENPWRHFTWIEGVKKEIRQFDHSELISLLDYFDSHWPNLDFAAAFVKVMLWSWGRRLEVSGLRWTDERIVGAEIHFETTGKWGVTKWFRIPKALREELESLKNDGDFVFGCYPSQLRDFYLGQDNRTAARRIRREFMPENLGDWMYHQVLNWSQRLPKGSAYLHVFRKTALQHALTGEHIEQTVAQEARITPSVMRASYARPSDEEFRRMSNRTFQRIRKSLPVDVAVRYGHEDNELDRLAEELDLARSQGDWKMVAKLAVELDELSEPER